MNHHVILEFISAAKIGLARSCPCFDLENWVVHHFEIN